MPLISFQGLLSHWPLLLLSLFLLRALYRRYLHPLHSIPGPFLASTTNLWRLFVFLRGRQHHVYHDLFQKYGPLVRLGPDTVILNDAAHFAEYFTYDKSPWIKAFTARLDTFDHGGVRDIKDHAKFKKQVMGGYSMSHVLKSEEKVDGHVSELMRKFESRRGEALDLAPWMQWVAFDVAMDVAFSNPLGFVKTASDVGGFIGSLQELMTLAGTLTIFPGVVAFLQQPWLFSMIAPKPTDTRGPGALYGLAWSQVNRRLSTKDEGEKPNDILQWLMDHQDKDGESLPQARLEQECVAPVLAGSDTSATVLRTIVLFLSTNQRVLNKLRAEIDAADKAGHLSTPPKYQEIKEHVPYISAIMKEALRLYPVVGVPLFRQTPKDKVVTICGYNLPPSTEIGTCQHATGRSTAIFGEDAESFRPERWTEDVDAATRKLRNEGDVFFGNGTMMCTGRNLATLEVWKIATQLFRQFDVEIVDPLQPWKQKASIAMLVWDFKVKLEVRTDAKPQACNEA